MGTEVLDQKRKELKSISVCSKHIQFQSNTPIYLLSVMHIATCFNFKESSSGYSMNLKIDTSSDSACFGISKVYIV
jgi:hypothetical protein